MDKKKLKTGEFEILKFKEGEQIIHVVRFHLYPVSKSGKSKDSGRIDDYYEPMGFKTYDGMNNARGLFEISNNIKGFKLKTEYETMTLKEFNKLRKNTKSYNYFIPTNEDNPKFKKRFKIANSQKIIDEREEKKQIYVSPIKSKTNIQICIKDNNNTFQDKEFGGINKEQFLTGKPSSRKQDEKGNALKNESTGEYIDFQIINGITKISSPKSWTTEIAEMNMRDFGNLLKEIPDPYETLISGNRIKEFEKTLFKSIVLPYLLTVKETEMEPTPFETCAHLFDTVFGNGEKNSVKEFYGIRLKIENELGITFRELISRYRTLVKIVYSNEYIEKVREFIGFRKTKIEIKGGKK